MRMKKAALFVFAVALMIGTPASLPGLRSRAFYAGDARAARPSAERIARHVQHLASDRLQGRRAGTAGADEAADYIEKEFRSYGLKPAARSGFLQPFEFVASVKLGARNSFQVKDRAGTRSLKLSEDFMPLAFSSSEPAAGELVFAGYGISAPELQYDNYAGLDVKGKVVMLFGGSPDGDNPHGRFAAFTLPGLEVQNKTLKAREKGARGVIFVSRSEEFQKDGLARLRHDLNFLDAGIPVVAVSRPAARALLDGEVGRALPLKENEPRKDALELAKGAASPFLIAGSTIEFKTDVVKVKGKSANVVGLLKGSDPKLASECVIIGAHYDHIGLGGPESLGHGGADAIHHGADDNASGTAALLELARVMAESPVKPPRSIVFAAFGAEELGLLGSAAYTKNPAVPLASTVAMLNMDMVGRLRDKSLFIGGAGTSPAWGPLLERLNSAPSEAGPQARFNLSVGQDGFGASDHQSFYVRDIPVLFFFTGTHEDYHKPSDTADKVNAAGAEQIADLVREVAVSVASEPQRIAFTKVKTEARPSGRGGFRVYLGTVPSYSDQNDGLKLDGVRPGSPAERAGLLAGDVIVKLGSVPIKNVYDYTYALGEVKAGEEIEVIIRRGGREMTLKITPERRQ